MNKSSEPMFFLLGQMEFRIHYNVVDGILCFDSGWLKFMKECSVHIGDILIIQLVDDSLRMKVCILKTNHIASGNIGTY